MKLLEAHRDRWLAELPTSKAPRLEWGEFERGFPGAPCGGLTVSSPWELRSAEPTPPADIGDCSRLDWDGIFWAAPLARLYLDHLTNWHVPLCHPETTRLKSLSLLGCSIDETGVESLLNFGQRFTGDLYLKQDELDATVEERLRAAFGERFSRETYWDI
jgi:hypothetical protein